MGIATISSYCGAQVFEAVGPRPRPGRPLLRRHPVGGRRRRPDGARLRGAGAPRARLSRGAPAQPARARRGLAAARRPRRPAAPGRRLRLAPRRRAPRLGPADDRRPAARGRQERERRRRRRPRTPSATRSSASGSTSRTAPWPTLRGLLELRPAGDPIPIDEVEPVTEILKRFTTGGMSLGALGPEAHETLAVAMNRIGGMSNSGEGGEDIRRYTPDPERRRAPLADQAGRLGPLRRHRPLPLVGRPDPDQDLAGREARRGRPAARATRSTPTSPSCASPPRASG